jgi:hypothetical protein
MYYNPVTKTLDFKASVSAGQFIAMGFGSSMVNTDMVAWINSGTDATQ